MNFEAAGKFRTAICEEVGYERPAVVVTGDLRVLTAVAAAVFGTVESGIGGGNDVVGSDTI